MRKEEKLVDKILEEAEKDRMRQLRNETELYLFMVLASGVLLTLIAVVGDN